MSGSEGRLSGLALDPEVVASLEAVLPRMAERTVAAVIAEVPAYADPFSGQLGPNIEKAVQNALGAFLRLAIRAENTDSAPSLSPALDGAYELGRGEARNGRSIDVAALGVPGRRQGGLARVVRDRRQRRAGSQDRRPVRRAGVRVHRRTVGIQRVRACRRAGHRGPGPAALSRSLSPLSCSPASRPRRCRPARSARIGLPRRPLPRCCCPPPAAADWRPSSAPKSCRPPRTCRAWMPRSRGRCMLVPDMDGARRPLLLSALRAAALSSAPRALGFWRGPPTSAAVRARSLRAEGTTVLDTDEHLVEIVLGADPDAAARPAPACAGTVARAARQHRRAPHGDAASLAAAPGPARRRRGRPVRPPADRALPDEPAARLCTATGSTIRRPCWSSLWRWGFRAPSARQSVLRKVGRRAG